MYRRRMPATDGSLTACTPVYPAMYLESPRWHNCSSMLADAFGQIPSQISGQGRRRPEASGLSCSLRWRASGGSPVMRPRRAGEVNQVRNFMNASACVAKSTHPTGRWRNGGASACLVRLLIDRYDRYCGMRRSQIYSVGVPPQDQGWRARCIHD